MAGTDSQIAGDKAIDLNARIGIVCHKESWGGLVKEYCVRAGFTNINLVYSNVANQSEPLNFDLVFVDENYAPELTGGELIDTWLINKTLSVTSAVIMVGDNASESIHNYDSIILLMDFLPPRFSEQIFNQKIWHSLLAHKVFFPALSYINEGRISYAYKSMGLWNKQELPQELLLDFCKLYVNIAFEVGKYQQVLGICNKPRFKRQPWTYWPRFKANYELGNWTFCEESLKDETFTELPSGSMKLFWQLRLFLEQENYHQAIELLETFPQQNMSLSMMRLVFAVFSVSGNWQQAEEFITRKIRLSQNEPLTQATLINTQCGIYLYEFYAASTTEHQQYAYESLKQHLKTFAEHKKAFAFKYSRAVFDLYLQIVALTTNPDEDKIVQLRQQLASLESNVTSPILMCRIAYAWHLLKQPDACFAAMLKADIAFSYTPLGCERLLLAMMHKQIVFNVYPESERFELFKRLGEEHAKAQRYKLSCKALARALDYRPGDKETRRLLSRSMTNAGVKVFAGYQIKHAELQ